MQCVRNRFLHAILTLLRGRGGQQIVWKRGAVRSLLRILKEGGRTALLMDQNTIPRDGGVLAAGPGVPAERLAGLTVRTRVRLRTVYRTLNAAGNGIFYQMVLRGLYARGVQ